MAASAWSSTLLLIVWCLILQAGDVLAQACGQPPIVKHAHYELGFGGWEVSYQCEDGFTPIGSSRIACREGAWTHGPPKCVGPFCPELGALHHGKEFRHYGGGVVSFSCREGYRLTGPSILACDGKQWNGTKPFCRGHPRQDIIRKKFQKALEHQEKIMNRLRRRQHKTNRNSRKAQPQGNAFNARL